VPFNDTFALFAGGVH